jgi:transcriptional regulator with XRE-family HTH domain
MQTFGNRPVTVPETTLAKRLVEARKHVGLGQTRMARELGVSISVLSKWENGHEVPRRGMIMAYALRCGVPLDWLEFGVLMGGDDYGPDPRVPLEEGDDLSVSVARREPEDDLRSRCLSDRVAS